MYVHTPNVEDHPFCEECFLLTSKNLRCSGEIVGGPRHVRPFLEEIAFMSVDRNNFLVELHVCLDGTNKGVLKMEINPDSELH